MGAAVAPAVVATLVLVETPGLVVETPVVATRATAAIRVVILATAATQEATPSSAQAFSAQRDTLPVRMVVNALFRALRDSVPMRMVTSAFFNAHRDRLPLRMVHAYRRTRLWGWR